MKLKMCFFCAFFMFSSVSGFADTINGFDGFKWGASRNDIVQIRGPMIYNFGTKAIWKSRDAETLAEFKIDLISYDFKEGCSQLKETISEPCFLWGGSYVLETTSQADLELLIKLLNDKYGKYNEEKVLTQEVDQFNNQLLANKSDHNLIWQFQDKSSVELYYITYDQDFVDKGKEYKKGIFTIGIRYFSSEYIYNKERKGNLKKSL